MHFPSLKDFYTDSNIHIQKWWPEPLISALLNQVVMWFRLQHWQSALSQVSAGAGISSSGSTFTQIMRLYFLLLYTSTPLHLGGKCCTFHSTAFICSGVTFKICHFKNMIRFPNFHVSNSPNNVSVQFEPLETFHVSTSIETGSQKYTAGNVTYNLYCLNCGE